MNVLGISASRRQNGNTDILIRAALAAARRKGAATRFLRLADLALEPCKGCMRCVMQGIDCPIPDAYPQVLEALRWADAVAVGSPTYVIGANAILHNFIDRSIGSAANREFAGKTGVALAAAGVRGWETFVLPEVSKSLLFFGMDLVDQFVGYGQGPGEVLDDPALLARAARAGEALAEGRREYLGEPGLCPVCHQDLVAPMPGHGARCLFCDLEGRFEDREGRLVFTPAPGASPRFSAASVSRHFEEAVKPSGPRFKARAKEYLTRVKAFLDECGEPEGPAR